MWAATWIAAACVTLLACTSEVEGDPAAQGGGGTGGGGGQSSGSGAGEPVDCDAPQTSCPASMPFPGGPCDDGLSCDYQEDGFEWDWTCQDGVWSGQANCDMLVGGTCPIAPPAETCSDPFAGQLSQAVLEVGPVEMGQPFRPFDAGESPEVVWGGQGSAMVFYRIAVDGEELPSCVEVDASLTPVGFSPESLKHNVRLRCGESLRLYLIVPFGTCEETEPVDTVLRVEVAGVGATEATLAIPPEAFCGGFG